MTDPALAPVVIHAYRRVEHLRRTIAALRENRLADRTPLYVTSDGPRPGDEPQVGEVREFLKSVTGFGRVEIVARDRNDRFENWRFRRTLAAEFGRVIVVEDDCVTSPGFLSYMNSCLDRFADDPGIFAISSFVPRLPGFGSRPLRLHRLQRFEPWGFGIFDRSDALVRQRPTPEEFNRLAGSREVISTLMRRSGLGLLGMIRKCAEGRLLAYDVMANLEVIRRDMRVIFPSGSLAGNIGIDGSGLHCGAGDHFETEIIDDPGFDWATAPVVAEPGFERAIARFHGSTPRAWLRYQSKRLRGKLKLPQG